MYVSWPSERHIMADVEAVEETPSPEESLLCLGLEYWLWLKQEDPALCGILGIKCPQFAPQVLLVMVMAAERNMTSKGKGPRSHKHQHLTSVPKLGPFSEYVRILPAMVSGIPIVLCLRTRM